MLCRSTIQATLTSATSVTQWLLAATAASFARSVLLFLVVMMTGSLAVGKEPVEVADYVSQIRPILEARCYSCHGTLRQEGALRLDTGALIRQGGDSGTAIVEGKPSESLLLQRITADPESRMPPPDEGAALKPDEIQLITAWIQQGATAPEEETPPAPNQHWAFQSLDLTKPNAAAAAKDDNLIDLYFRKVHQQQVLKPQAMAERSLRIRRLYLDLTGLPPSAEQMHDVRPWAEIVDELLLSPHHGERWARHWMDIWRYSDWYGLGAQLRYSQKHLWHWRDWIVESLNQDKGYDRMIREMLAGDELDPTNPNVVRATGFLARNYYLFNRTTWLDSTIEHTGKAFLGLTLNCAKCHDHKYDPFSAADYYQLRAIFEPHQVRLDPVPGTTDLESDGLPRVFDDHLDAVTYVHRKGDPANPDTSVEIKPGIPALFASDAAAIEEIPLPLSAYAPIARDYVQKDLTDRAEARVIAARKELQRLQSEVQSPPPTAKSAEKPDKSVALADDAAAFQVTDDFSVANSDLWNIVGDGWKYADGTLQQTTATRDAQYVRLIPQLPDDFDLTCRYTTTGGTTYKSVTFRFDETEDRQNSNYVYTSAHAPGPKVQAAWIRNGNSTYPANGRVVRPIQVGVPMELRFAVRDRLVNVWLNGEFVLAFEFPDRPAGRSLSLSGFDATVAFDAIEIRNLPIDEPLRRPTDAAQPPRSLPERLQIAEAKLNSAEAALHSLKATIVAELSLASNGKSEQSQQQVKEAARLQALADQAEAEHLLLAAADDKEKKSAKEKLDQVTKKLASVPENPDDNSVSQLPYTPLRVSRKALETPAHKETDYATIYPERSTGRRTALAEWIASPQNPLTARVAVNHVWMRHFGEPLVESVFDFGLRTKAPVHQELLDQLAVEFMRSGWSFRHLHRLIVASEAYQRTSSELHADPATLSADPTNQFYWRMNARRMESQIVRDSLLQLAGVLDVSMGGPSVPVNEKSRRRSLYFLHSRDDQNQLLSMFDDADLLQCYRRSESIVPQQALALSNSELSMTMAAEIAERLSTPSISTAATESKDSASQQRRTFIDTAFFTILGRHPDSDETSECLAFCEQLATGGVQEQRIRTRLIHALINHNDFITIR
ncbi:MAG: DUF1553 domain-containing protein [Planctomycetaceae bacterium]|nr:DUF1553 domain-containing protein [Planctomycetaceae bacterium]